MRCSGAAVRLSVQQVAADRHLALRRGPQDGVHLALDDAARVHLHEDFRLVARLDVAQFVLVKKASTHGSSSSMKLMTGLVANCVARTPGRSARFATRPLAGARCVVPSRSYFALRGRPRTSRSAPWRATSSISPVACARELLLHLRFRGVGGEEFAFEIAEIGLCACSRSARFPAPVAASAVNCSTRFFARSIRGVERGFLRRGVLELILQPALVASAVTSFALFCASVASAAFTELERHRVHLEKHVALLDRPVRLDRHFGDLSRSRAARSG